MDKKYIKMSDCPEIQEQKKCVEGDMFYGQFYKRSYVWIQGYTGYKDIWLPRQDQLQEMVGYKGLPYLLTQMFERSVNGGDCNYTWNNGEHFTSMEQLWLAFVMKEKYDKTWDGTKWI